jgi:cytochrome c oxidase cbb3-type subunit III
MIGRYGRFMIALLLSSSAFVLASCEREARRLNQQPPPGAPPTFVAQSPLQPGPTLVVDTAEGEFDDNAYNTSEGQTLFNQMNCSGCHANGGGNMGPALMDDEWLYGSEPNQIFASIAEGRPNGMPSWKNRLNDKQIWQLVAYVRSLSGLTPKGARPARQDHMMMTSPPNQTPKAKPRNSGLPGASQHP